MTHIDGALEQPDIVSWYTRLVGGQPSAQPVTAMHEVRPVVDILGLVPVEVTADQELNTPLAGRTATFTVPGGQMWRIHHVASRNADTAVAQQHRITPRQGGTNLTINQTASQGANVHMITRLDPPLMLGPQGTIEVIFGQGVLNDDTIALVGFQRFYL